MELDTDLMTPEQAKALLMKFQKETLAEALYDYTNATRGTIEWEYLKAVDNALRHDKKTKKAFAMIHLMEQLNTGLSEVEENTCFT